MSDRPTITPNGEHRYLLRGTQDDEPVEVRVIVDPQYTDLIGVAAADEQAAVQATVDFLLEQQRIDDLPPTLEIRDVLAAYDGIADQLRDRVARITSD